MDNIQTTVNEEIKLQPNPITLAALAAKDENTYQNIEELAKLWK